MYTYNIANQSIVTYGRVRTQDALGSRSTDTVMLSRERGTRAVVHDESTIVHAVDVRCPSVRRTGVDPFWQIWQCIPLRTVRLLDNVPVDEVR